MSPRPFLLGSRWIAAGSVLLSAAALLLALPTTASARSGDIIAQGGCTGSTSWKLKLAPRDGGLETEYSVDSNRNGQTWSVTLSDNGTQVFSGVGVTKAPSGSFSIKLQLRDLAGPDTVKAVASNAATGEICTGTAVA